MHLCAPSIHHSWVLGLGCMVGNLLLSRLHALPWHACTTRVDSSALLASAGVGRSRFLSLSKIKKKMTPGYPSPSGCASAKVSLIDDIITCSASSDSCDRNAEEKTRSGLSRLTTSSEYCGLRNFPGVTDLTLACH